MLYNFCQKMILCLQTLWKDTLKSGISRQLEYESASPSLEGATKPAESDKNHQLYEFYLNPGEEY